MEVNSVAEKLFYTTVRLDGNDSEGRYTTGTGFIFTHQVEGQVIPVIVTNKHVVEGQSNVSVTFTLKEDERPLTGEGFRLNITEFQKGFIGHPDSSIDIAVIPLNPLIERIRELGSEIYFNFIPTSMVPSEAVINNLDAYEELIFVGYPNSIWDETNLLPIMRRGATATPISVDFDGKPQFLLDGSVFRGSSGSPVFIYNPGMYYDKSGTVNVGTRIIFVGILASVFVREEKNEVIKVPIPTSNERLVSISEQMLDLGVVFKSHLVIETIEHLARNRGLIE